VEQEQPVSLRGDHHRAAREVALDDAAVEGVGVPGHERADRLEVARFLDVGRDVVPELLVKAHGRAL
jgi:hypothetical protein